MKCLRSSASKIVISKYTESKGYREQYATIRNNCLTREVQDNVHHDEMQISSLGSLEEKVENEGNVVYLVVIIWYNGTRAGP